MRLQAGEIGETLSIAAEAGEFSRATAWLESICNGRGVPADTRYRLDICLNEALANVLAHGGAAALAVSIGLRLAISGGPDEGTARLTLKAGGVPFDPASHRTRPSPRTLEEAEPGGLGILMMRTNADRIDYERLGDTNCTSFLVRWGTGSDDDGRRSGPPADTGD